MTYPLKMREHILKTKEKEQLSFEQTSQRFGISMRTLFRWHKKIEPCTTRNKPATKLNMKGLEEDVKNYPDAYNHERAERLGVGKSTIFYGLRRLGVSYKKNSFSPQSQRTRQAIL